MSRVIVLACWFMTVMAAPTAAVDFDTQIMPVFTKAGCNSGACHGAAIGRGGFALSLYGGDPDADYEAIVHQLQGRRINLARAGESLLLAKPTGLMDHGGGERLDPDGEGARRIENWVRAGAPRLNARKFKQLLLSPRRLVVERLGERVPLEATAEFDDKSSTDVTRWTVFTAADSGAVKIEARGGQVAARVLRRGQHVITARYLSQVVPLTLVAPYQDEPVRVDRQALSHNFIDTHIFDALATLRVPPAPPADDAAFLRRVRLDLTGRLPSPEEVRQFIGNKAAAKRATLIDRLLASDEFVEYWTFRFAKLLRIRSQPKENAPALAFHRWLREQIARQAPYDEMARSLLTASGDTHTHGPANFYRVAVGPRMQAEYVSELFMGVRLRCANCHNHPLDQWTQDDYHGLSAVFARMEQGRVVRVGRRGEVTHPRTGEPALPRIPGQRYLNREADGRADLAAWLTDENNPYFAKALVNRLWKAMLGRGLIEPADDLRATNPATHPELLERLAADFRRHKYDIRHTLRLIAGSAVYQRSSRPAAQDVAADEKFYSRALWRPLEAEVLADALADVTGVAESYGGQPLGTRAIALFSPTIKSPALDILGRCDRRESCESDGTAAGGMSKKLHLINGALINRKIASPQGRLRKLMTAGKSNDELVLEFYLRALGRSPRTNERMHWSKVLRSNNAEDRRKSLEDFAWSLLNSREFQMNH